MTYAELRRMTLTGNYGDLDLAGDDLVMVIRDSFGDEIGLVTFEFPSGNDEILELENVDVDKLVVKSFDFFDFYGV